MPIDLIGPRFMEDVVAVIRRTYPGPLRMAHDLTRIDLWRAIGKKWATTPPIARQGMGS
jgi:hypothetical protein